MMPIGFPAGQRPAALDESRGVEIANTTGVAIESEIATKAQQRRDLQLDDLLAVPSWQHVEPAETWKELPLAADRHVYVRKGRQLRPNHLEVALRRYDQKLQRLGVHPVVCQRLDEERRAIQIAAAARIAQRYRQNCIADLGKHEKRPVTARTPGHSGTLRRLSLLHLMGLRDCPKTAH